VNLALVLFILAQGTRSMLHRVYAVWGCSIVVWNIGTAFMFSARNPEQALIWARFLHFGVVFLPVSLFHLWPAHLPDFKAALGEGGLRVCVLHGGAQTAPACW